MKSIMVNLRFVSTLITILFLAGCSQLQTTHTPVQWQQHQLQLKQIHNYQIVGKLGYITPGERRTFNFQWQRSDTNSQLRLTTFLGQTVLKIEVTPRAARAETYEGQTYQAATPEALLIGLTGLNIPLDALRDWILGLPTRADRYSLNAEHTLEHLTKILNGRTWEVSYQSYTEVTLGQHILPLPRQLSLKQSHTKINLRISKWTVTP
jgi:outer membrane lipoprotein LolB